MERASAGEVDLRLSAAVVAEAAAVMHHVLWMTQKDAAALLLHLVGGRGGASWRMTRWGVSRSSTPEIYEISTSSTHMSPQRRAPKDSQSRASTRIFTSASAPASFRSRSLAGSP